MSNQPSASRSGRSFAHLALAFLSKFWVVGLALACTPVYVSQLGVEGYGVIGFFLALQRVANLLDSGFSRTINREFAQQGNGAADLLRTLEAAYWSLCLLLLFAAIMASGWVASGWSLEGEDPYTLLLLMSLAIALQLPSGYYLAAITGQERHAVLNSIIIVWHGLRFLGSAVLLWFWPSLTLFFAWQVIVSLGVTAASAAAVWLSLNGIKARIKPSLFSRVSAYTGGGALCAITAVLLTQVDKLILWRSLPSDEFGCYMIAWSLASAMFLVTSPIQTVFFPKFSRLWANGDDKSLAHAYHLGSQLLSLAVIPLMACGVFFSYEALYGWLGDPELANRCWPIAAFLFAGVGVNCLSSTPHSLQMASGWTGLSNQLNIVSLAVFGPGVLIACSQLGASGAAGCWLLFAGGYLVFQVRMMNRRLLSGEAWAWSKNLLFALAVSLAAACLMRLSVAPVSRIGCLTVFMLAWVLSAAGVVAISPLVRERVVKRLGKGKRLPSGRVGETKRAA